MAVLRDNPYGAFNFLVDIGGSGGDGPHAGFAEAVLPEVMVEVVDYRQGNDRVNTVRKLPVTHKHTNLTLKRGYAGSLDLWQWYEQVRNGDPNFRRPVRIVLHDEAHHPVLTWKLSDCFPVKMQWGPLDAKGNGVAIEYLELACERLDLE